MAQISSLEGCHMDGLAAILVVMHSSYQNELIEDTDEANKPVETICSTLENAMGVHMDLVLR